MKQEYILTRNIYNSYAHPRLGIVLCSDEFGAYNVMREVRATRPERIRVTVTVEDENAEGEQYVVYILDPTTFPEIRLPGTPEEYGECLLGGADRVLWRIADELQVSYPCEFTLTVKIEPIKKS